jgi:hypothetical protein
MSFSSTLPRTPTHRVEKFRLRRTLRAHATDLTADSASSPGA